MLYAQDEIGETGVSSMGFSRDTLSWAPAWRQALMGTKAWDVPEKLPKRSGQEDCSSRRNPSVQRDQA